MRDFTRKHIRHYEKLETVQEKAAFLLDFEIVAKTNIKGLDFVNQAFIGKVALPITGGSDEEVVSRAKKWLRDKASEAIREAS